MTSGWETERVYSYNPGACTGHGLILRNGLELKKFNNSWAQVGVASLVTGHSGCELS